MDDDSASSSSSSSASSASASAPLQFQPFASAVDVSFWSQLAHLKLDVLHLSTDPIQIYAEYTAPASSHAHSHSHSPPPLCLGSYSFVPAPTSASGSESESGKYRYRGELYNVNTIEAFKAFDVNQTLNHRGQSLWAAIAQSGSDSDHARVRVSDWLRSFFVLTFADLKHHHYYYWFNLTAVIHPKLAITHTTIRPLSSLGALPLPEDGRLPAFFRVDSDINTLTDIDSIITFAPTDSLTLGFVDPCHLPNNPGWPARNFLLWAAVRYGLKRCQLICWRGSVSASIVIDIALIHPGASVLVTERPEYVGFERNKNQKFLPRKIDLSALSNPEQLAATSVDLNLKLMRWRALPSLNLSLLTSSKCLLLGAGTLGCNVSRLLLAWGVKHIDFVDNGRVSHSNPVRQSLYTFSDAVNHSDKAVCAAESLKRIYPHVASTGYQLTIPMPGHAVNKGDEKEVKATISKLMELIQQADVIFLLTDSRESRWLPTLLGKAYGKLVLNCALGFDSYLVMRHGTISDGLGCYYCNDVVAPTDSLSDRTLDQQCTVTRPGLAYVASAMTVELLVNLLQSNDRVGEIPHTVRGWIGQFNTVKLTGQAFHHCTACSSPVLAAYGSDGIDFLLTVLNSGVDFLETLSGLKAMKEETERRMAEHGGADSWDGDEDDVEAEAEEL